jgi:tetratricopeptide (TPR) repeat protein
LLAATNLKNNAKTIEYAEKVLKDEPKNINALVTLSGVLSATMPTTAGPAQTAHITRTLDITKQALTVPKPQEVAEAQWNPIQLQLHETASLMLLNQMKYSDSIVEAQAALKINSKDSYAWYLIGLNHKASLADLIKKYRALLDKYNENRTTADQIALDEMKTAYQVAEKIASDKTDETLDAFARSVAAGGPSATPAREELQKLFTGTPDELNKMIEEKKKTLTGN